MQHLARIVTHPGGAHKDDLLACSVLAALHGCPIERRDPTPEDLADAATATVDIGGSHDAACSNFDHHHFPREHPPTCALSLVLQALDLYDDARLFCDWLEPAEWFDSRGPKRTAEWLGVPRRAVSQLNSPIDATLLRRFAAAKLHQPGETVYDYLRLVGQDLLDYLRTVRHQLAFVTDHGERWSVTAGPTTIETVFLPRSEQSLEEPSAGVAHWIRKQGLDGVVGAMIYPDRRGPGYGMQRYEDDARLDFTRLAGEPDVHFAHASGFVCKTSAQAPERLRELLARAVVG
ncbi:MAG: MYG1 family protein [Planctomycetes bacterium]|nr:MYG1 family protein [Planctomycetota bacterium]